MPAIPFPFYTLSILLILLLKVCLQRASGLRSTAMFIGACTLLVLMSALRWQFDALFLRQLQSMVAIALPPLAWHCFAHFTGRNRRQKFALCALPPAIALVFNLAAPDTTDIVLVLLYLGYGAGLITTARQGADAFVFSRLSEATITSRMALLAGSFLCFSALTDLVIALDFHFYHGQQAPQLVAISQAILLPFICLAIVYRGKAAPVELPTSSVEHEASADDKDLLATYQHIEARIREQHLFLNTDLTLNTLAKKLGIPARQISRAVNQTCGCNVSQWINRFRIHYAQQLLRNSDAPVTAIMLDSGFATKSNFNREFIRISGMSPTDYRLTSENKPVSVAETR